MGESLILHPPPDQLDFVLMVADSLKNVRMGIVFIDDIPSVKLNMSTYSYAELRKWTDSYRGIARGKTSVGHAIYLAREMLKVKKCTCYTLPEFSQYFMHKKSIAQPITRSGTVYHMRR
ncbi:hypothetical protein ANCCAN_02566 [Ancylostoma caninum]|uniref:Uncharacterized protein n=1 Tax=Ancylostoma caninum TaxID=29170 RepID=A0A368H7F9_ANCCA|nr:hypothetical protein ANCCAN_02566 [Ancylostoma caninum]